MSEYTKIHTVVGYSKKDPSKTAAQQWIDEGNEATNRARRMIAEGAICDELQQQWGISWQNVVFEYVERYYRADD